MGVSKLSNSPLTRSSRSLVNRLYDSSFDRVPLSMMSTQCSLTLFVVWSSGQSIEPAPNTLDVLSFLVAFLLTIDCEQLARRDESIGLINIMLLKHLTLNVILINELMLLLCLARLICSEAFDFTQCH